MKLLLVEDDVALAAPLKMDLERAGYVVDTAADGEHGEFLGATEDYDAAILDLGLPKLAGLDVLKRWRDAGNATPVIVLTARDAWYEKVDGFKAGADDYLGKPFHPQELLVRLQAILKRVHRHNQFTLQVLGVLLDEDEQTAAVNGGEAYPLTAIEFRLLRYFMMNAGKVLTKSQLGEHIYSESDEPDSNVIEVYVKRLRKIVGSDLIQTRRGQGYVFGSRP
ncbi:response regulator transcription factor [Methylomonas sp. MED-D]|uniref:response regulator transcription factor n=1 Tax=unclassified Methylomonas TaxID=2608980 RepID=UPI0008DA9A9A|nr:MULTISPECIES: response regulator transcription factor [unclassified Methylomonas]MDT4332148.1 response regulator transcription factor [Methylomonas sp. MV1]OHX35522.1 DNA-binding response regulator [Methylomonas sp. LWB]WGS85681.1 response regulator transcription factor [Methylomonas sp. UP202]